LLSWAWIQEDVKRFQYYKLLDQLKVPESLRAFTLFKHRILDKAIKEINETENLTIKYKKYKIGKSISAVDFIY
jgi:plasmid replication initiation protein